MSKKLAKNFIIATLTILSIGAFAFAPAVAKADGLIDVIFEGEPEPLFKEANFLPGQEVVRWVEVTNKSTQILPIGVKATSLTCPGTYCLADKLQLEIKNGTTLYGPVSLTKFYNDGEIELSDLGAGIGVKETYNFSVTFLPESGDDYQGLEVSFDFQIGALGTESISGEIPPGGGGYFITGLEISNENVPEISGDSVTITWNTNKLATSRVIYSSEIEPHVLQLDNLPNYGYFRSTVEDTNLVTTHTVIISGLNSGTTYYYRCVSHGSLAISQEYNFTTLGVKEIGEIEEEIPTEEIPPSGGEVLGEETTTLGEETTTEGSNQQQFTTPPTETPGGTEQTASVANTLTANAMPRWLILIIVLAAAALIWFIYERMKER